MPGTPLVPIEIMQQFFGEVRLPSRAAAEGKVDPVEVAFSVGGIDGFGYWPRAMAASSVVDAQVLFCIEEAMPGMSLRDTSSTLTGMCSLQCHSI